MDPSGIAIFDLAEQRLAWADQRQTVLAQNIANLDTPGWKARDVTPFAALLTGADIAPAQTNPMHLGGVDPATGQVRPVASLRSPDGNGVGMEAELTKIAETDATHEMVSDLYKKYMGLFRTVIGH